MKEKQKVGRKPRNEKAAEKILAFRVTAGERETIYNNALATGQRMGEYCRDKALQVEPKKDNAENDQ